MTTDRRSFLFGMMTLTAGSLLPLAIHAFPKSNMNKTIPMNRPKILIFDVNETLLNLDPMKERINRVFNHDYAFQQWFALMLQYSLVDNVTGQYHDFGEIGKAAYKMTAEVLGIELPESEMEPTLKMIRTLPPHPDVEPALLKLQQAGYRMVTLTNSTEDVVNEQMKSAGLTTYFERLMSIDPLKKYKPALETYQQAVQTLGVLPEEAMLIAAHGWDVTGALHAGLQAAFISRPGNTEYPLSPEVRFTGNTLTEIAETLVKLGNG